MSFTIEQIFVNNPATSNQNNDLFYFVRTPYNNTDDYAINWQNFSAQFGAPYTAAALTTGNDTNVTLTLSGTPTTALLHAAQVTAGWTGQLSLARGGSNANLTAAAGGLVYSTASAMAIGSAGTSGQLAQSAGTSAPGWTTSTYPATNAAYTLLYASAANTMAALANGTTGQVLTATTGAAPSWSAPSGGPYKNIVISSSDSGAFTVTSATFAAVPNMSVTITTLGGPVHLMLQAAITNDYAGLFVDNVTVNYAFFRGATQLNNEITYSATDVWYPSSSVQFIDTPTAGTYTYTLEALSTGSANQIKHVNLVAMEI